MEGLSAVSQDFKAQSQSERRLDLTRQLLSDMQDAETGQRGYLLTRQPEYLEPYLRATAQIDTTTRYLEDAGLDPAMVARVRELSRLKLDELAETIELTRKGQHEEALNVVRSNREKQYMDQLRNIIAQLQSGVVRDTASRQEALAKSMERAWTELIVGAGMISVLFALVGTGSSLVRGTATAAGGGAHRGTDGLQPEPGSFHWSVGARLQRTAASGRSNGQLAARVLERCGGGSQGS
ncbi:MAG: hypothetical protein NVS9B15_14800 [Acidobacteriaceae bacterium]